MCARRRLRSTWASTQSDQRLRCAHEESLGPNLPIKRTAKTLIRLCGCPVWSESSPGARVILLVLSWCCPLCLRSFSWFCVIGRRWNLIVSVPDYCLLISFTNTGISLQIQIQVIPLTSRYLLVLGLIWARSCENVSYAICEQQRRRSACASVQSDQGLCCSLPG